MKRFNPFGLCGMVSVLGAALILVACGGSGGGSSGASSGAGGSSSAASASSEASSSSQGSSASTTASAASSSGTSVMPVQASSYLNAKNIGIAPVTLPSPGALAYAFGDFFQDGSYGLVYSTQNYCIPGSCSSWQTAAASADEAVAGTIHFFKNVSGTWVDATSSILSDTTGCVHARKAAVADFNGDGKPDVIFACHGYDASPYPGENARILLSGASGYTNTKLAISGYLHGVTAFDPTGSGYADVVFTGVGSTTGGGTPAYFTNNGDGTFTQTGNISVTGMTSVYTVEAIDINSDGYYDILFSGHETSGGQQSAIYYGSAAGTWSGSSAYLIPVADTDFGFILDAVYVNGKLNVLRTVDDSTRALGFYGAVELEQINLSDSTFTTPYIHTTTYSSGMNWIPWMMPYNGYLVSVESLYGMSVAQ